MDIQNDIQLRGLKQMDNCPTTQEDINNGKRIHERCVSILFNDDVVKTFEIKGELKIDKIKNNDGTIAEFSYRIPYIVYGDIRYDIPDAANVYVDDDYILYTSSVYDGLETVFINDKKERENISKSIISHFGNFFRTIPCFLRYK